MREQLTEAKANLGALALQHARLRSLASRLCQPVEPSSEVLHAVPPSRVTPASYAFYNYAPELRAFLLLGSLAPWYRGGLLTALLGLAHPEAHPSSHGLCLLPPASVPATTLLEYVRLPSTPQPFPSITCNISLPSSYWSSDALEGVSAKS
jgi:hypothetical protein